MGIYRTQSGNSSYGGGTAQNPQVQDSYQETSTPNQPVPISRSKSVSSSFQNSDGSSSSESGDFYTPQQNAWISALYPQLAARFGASNPQAAMQRDFSYYHGGVGGAPASFPGVTPSPVWSPEMIQQRVNQMRAQNSTDAGGQLRQTSQRLSGAGFQANSPLYQELAGGIQGRALAASSSGENDLRFQAAQGNASNILKGQQLALDTASASSADERARRAMGLAARAQDIEGLTSQQNALLQALGYYNRPLQKSKSQSQQQSRGGSSSVSQSESGASSDPLVQELPW